MKQSRQIVAAIAIAAVFFSGGVIYGRGGISFDHADKLNSENTTLPADLDYSTAESVYDALKDNYDGKLTQTQLLDGVKAGLAQSTGDPYTEFFSASEAKTLNEQLTGTFSGIGAQLGKNAAGVIEIIAPITGSPAEKAGLKPGDLISKINGTTTSNLDVDIAVSKIRGESGTTVTLQIYRNGVPQDYTITRANISIPSVESKMLDGNIGYLRISQFTDDTTSGPGTAELARKAAQSFKDQGVKGVVLDMRSNPGGTVDSAISVSSLWVPQGKTVMVEKRGGQVVKTNTATGGNILNGIPTIVLIDEGSASASEITAGALKDNKVATTLGAKSYGKGSFQTVLNLSGDSELKVTIGRWYRPNGQNIDKQGIKPDQVVKQTDSGDAQLDAATAKLKS
ncbi:MAG: family peptidase [Candidatus Saccharibacteria bacterium]|nr:family peptidase [Candidatus Saccharibacteria bacterium]